MHALWDALSSAACLMGCGVGKLGQRLAHFIPKEFLSVNQSVVNNINAEDLIYSRKNT